MFVIVVGLNHKTAPVEVREKLAFSNRAVPEVMEKLKTYPSIDGCAILSTCNRMEIYAAATDVEIGLKSIHKFLQDATGIDLTDIHNYFYSQTCENGVRHLFRVAAGLDSMVLGESQILGQVKEAYQLSCDNNSSNGVLNTLFQQAITVGKRVRTETEIDKNAVSISYAAVEKAKQVFGSLEGYSTLIIGAGEMSELTAKHLVANGVSSVLVSNRSYERAKLLAEQFGGKAIKFDLLFDHLHDADIVISCTASPKYILSKEQMASVMAKRNNRQLFMIDIAVPRDIEPTICQLAGVTLLDIDDLQYVVDKNLEERKKEAIRANDILEQELDLFLKWLNSLFVVPTIIALKEKGRQIKENELTKALNKLGEITPREHKIISTLANSIVNSLLHDPILNLKEYANTNQGHLYSEIAQNLFNIDIEGQRKKDRKPEKHNANHVEENFVEAQKMYHNNN
ncbi:MAG: glutamyl-tRNA reductase [Bacillota bacterium]|nr:glutamyl-tRNA reductase [Bacillota bacterium]